MVRSISLLLCLPAISSFAQEDTALLSQVRSVAQAEAFVKNHPGVEPSLFTISSDRDTSAITLPLFDKAEGYTFSIDRYTYKIIKSTGALSFRVSYIYLDGSQLPAQVIDSIRNVILFKYKTGTAFFDLVSEYNIDFNGNGDLGWFTEKMMMPEFETAVRRHKRGDIFTVDIPSNKWYYVVMKTFDDTIIKTLTLIRIKSGG